MPFRALRYRKLQHKQGDGNREDAVAERLHSGEAYDHVVGFISHIPDPSVDAFDDSPARGDALSSLEADTADQLGGQ
jgi:hypothetical protein